MIDLHPTVCNLCGGQVELISNARIYGREYGSGKCYYCTQCGAFVGTHKPHPDEALGLLSDEKMREAKKKLHGIFDGCWLHSKSQRETRSALYRWLAVQMGLPREECHIGYFDMRQMEQAYRILQSVSGKTAVVSKKGNVRFE